MTSSPPSERKTSSPPKGAASSRVARVVPDVSGIEGEFDYIIPAKFDALVDIGSLVRVNFHGRRVSAWVIDADSTPPPGKRLLELEHVTGYGPDQELIDLAGWAAWRYAGKRSFFLQTASPQRAVKSLARREPSRGIVTPDGSRLVEVLRVPPARSPLPEVLAAGEDGPVLLITPTQRSAQGWARRLKTEGKRVAIYPDDWDVAAEGRADYVVGTRAAAWAPMPSMVAVVVVDCQDDGLQSEASPTWNAVDIVVERSRRRGAMCKLISSVPRVEQSNARPLINVDGARERNGWAPLVVVDQRNRDPRSGLYSDELVNLVRSDKRVLCVLNRKGRAQLLVCSGCDEVAKCGNCGGGQQLGDDLLVCSRCKVEYPVVCVHCGRTKFKQLRLGVSKVREELEALGGSPVGEITGDSDLIPDTRVVVGTAAVLYRIQNTDAVVFIDFDQDLLAARYRAPEDALIALARAARAVGGRSRGGRVVVQTRNPKHEVIDAALHGEPERFTKLETERRKQMDWPPFSALARISGKNAAAYVEGLTGVELMAMGESTWLAQGRDHTQLSDALARNPRPKAGNLRVEVDPPRV